MKPGHVARPDMPVSFIKARPFPISPSGKADHFGKPLGKPRQGQGPPCHDAVGLPREGRQVAPLPQRGTKRLRLTLHTFRFLPDLLELDASVNFVTLEYVAASSSLSCARVPDVAHPSVAPQDLSLNG